MQILDNTQKNSFKNKLTNFFNQTKNKRNLAIQSVVLISTITVLFFPISILTKDNKPEKRFIRRSLVESLNLIDKRYGFLADETIQFGGNFFSIAKRYLNSSFINEDNIQLNINMDGINKLRLASEVKKKKRRHDVVSPRDAWIASCTRNTLIDAWIHPSVVYDKSQVDWDLIRNVSSMRLNDFLRVLYYFYC